MKNPIDPQPLPKLSEVEWAYVAGVLDSAATLSVTRATRSVRLEVKRSGPLPRELHALLGGTMSGTSWCVARQQRLQFILTRVAPFLRVKRRRAELVLGYLSVAKWSDPGSPARVQAFDTLTAALKH